MKSAWEVELEQDEGAFGVFRPHRDTVRVLAVNALIAGSKALRLARGNGWIKSRPVVIRSVSRIARDLR